MKYILSFLILFFASTVLIAQELSRRPLLGVMLQRVDEDTKRIMKLPDLKGVLVKSVIANSTAEKAGFKTGDIIRMINNKEVNAPDEAVNYVASCAGGQNFTYELLREGKQVSGNAVFESLPEEKYEGIEMHYKAAQTVNGQQRLIVSKLPGAKKRPAIVFIGGIGCYSLDFPLEKDRSEVLLLNKLTQDGFVCIRAEKPGVGDNRQCTPCKDVSFYNEISGYTSIINALKKYDYIDSSRIYIFGHSMGGVMAPVIAKQTSIKGIIAYGTIGSNFIEYLAKSRRTIAEAFSMTPEETDEYIKDYCECAGYYFVDGLTTAEASKKKSACDEYLSIFDLRSPAYNKELYNLNIPLAWKSFKGKVLMVWGESDYVSAKEDHEIVVKTVNFYNPGKAQFISIKAASHAMTHAENYSKARDTEGSYNQAVGDKISHWLKTAG